MKIFASDLSPALATIAKENRPLPCELDLSQMIWLTRRTDFSLERPANETYFIIYHPDHTHGLDSPFTVDWMVEVISQDLIYSPVVQSRYLHGSDTSITDQMGAELSTHLASLGFVSRILFSVIPEPVVFIPAEYRRACNNFSLMLQSEFRSMHGHLYQFMKKYFD